MNAQCLNTHIVSDLDPTPAEMATPLQRTPLELAR